MKRTALHAASMVMAIGALLWGASAWADDAHHPPQAAPAETQSTPGQAVPSAQATPPASQTPAPSKVEPPQGRTPGQTQGGMMMSCPMMGSGQAGQGGTMGCRMMPSQAQPDSPGTMPGQTQGMGPGMMHGQMQPGGMQRAPPANP
jgi:hypothetical protein